MHTGSPRAAVRLLAVAAVLAVTGAAEASAKSAIVTFRGEGISDDRLDLTFDVYVQGFYSENPRGRIQDIEADNLEITGCPTFTEPADNITFEFLEPITIEGEEDDAEFRGDYQREGLRQSFSGRFIDGQEDDLDGKLAKVPRAKGLLKFTLTGDGYTCSSGRVDWKARAVRRVIGAREG